MNETPYSSLDLIPQNPQAILQNLSMALNVLHCLEHTTDFLVRALKAFYLEKSYRLFDPHVGDTACQIRACKLLVIASKPIDEFAIQAKIKSFSQMQIHIAHIKTTLTPYSLGRNNLYSIDKFYKKYGIFYQLSETELFLFQCYFLTYYKKINAFYEAYIDYEFVKNQLGSTKKLAKKLIRHHQLILAKSSVDFIIDLAKPYYNDEEITLLKTLCRLDDDCRTVLPCFYMSKIIFNYLTEKQIPFLFTIKQKQDQILIFYKKTQNGCYQPKKIKATDMNDEKAYFVVSGKTLCNEAKDFSNDYLTKLFSIDLDKLFLGNMAAHPQYTGNTLLPYRMNPFSSNTESNSILSAWRDELFELQHWARQQGCCLENPSLFLTEHIFYARINELKSIPDPFEDARIISSISDEI